MAEKNLSVKLSLNDKQFQSNLKKSTRSLKKFGDTMKKTGQAMTRNLTLPFVAFSAVAVKAFDEQIKAETKLRTALKGNEEAFKNLKLQAQELQKVTLFGDEATIEAQSFLAQLGLTEQQILMITPALQDFATGMGIDLKTAASLVGKTVGTTTDALKRYFDTGLNPAMSAQEKAIKLTETLTNKFGGQAEAVSKVGLGPLQQLNNQLGDVSEQLGSIVIDGIEPLKNMLQSLADALSGTSKATKENIVQYGTLAAVIGPILIIVGKLITAFATLRKFFILKLIPAITTLFNVFKLLTPQGRAIGIAISAAAILTSQYEKLVKVFKSAKDAILGVSKAQKGLDFTKQTPQRMPSDILQSMASGRAVNPVTGKPFFTPKKKTKAPTTSFNKSAVLDRIEPIKILSLELNKVAESFDNAEKTATGLTESLTPFEELGNKITNSFQSFGNTIQGVFAQSLQSSEGFFKSFIEGSKQAFKAMLAQIAAMVAMKSILAAFGFGSLDLAAGSFSKGIMNILPFANGGLVTGATLGLIGEGAGTSISNPEVVAPLDKLKSMISDTGGGNVEVYGTIKGSDILLSSDRAKNNRNRTRGY